VAAGVVEVLALQQDARPARVLREPLHLRERGGTARILAQKAGQLRTENRVGHGLGVREREFVERRDERLGHVTSAEIAEERPGLVAQ
jgi:hypothetical protein